MKLKKGDEVLITLGKDKGKRGKIEKIFPKEKKALLPNLNVYKRHLKKKEEKGGGVIQFSRPLPLSALMLICPECHQPTRVGWKSEKEKKFRFCKKCGSKI